MMMPFSFHAKSTFAFSHLCSLPMLSYQSGFQESLFLCPRQKISLYQYM